jgi:hypothetical protein
MTRMRVFVVIVVVVMFVKTELLAFINTIIISINVDHRNLQRTLNKTLIKFTRKKWQSQRNNANSQNHMN